MTSIAANYRSFQLPWTPSEAEEKRFRRVLGAAIGLFVAFGVIVPFLPVHHPPPTLQPAVTERAVEFILEQPKPKVEVPPPKPVVVPKVQARAELRVPVPKVVPKVDPRKKAAASGLLAMTDQLEKLRDMDVDRNPNDTPLNAGVGEKTRVDRNILTAKAGQNSGGIAVSAVSSGFGGGSTGLKGNSTARVTSTVAAPAPGPSRTGSSNKAARSREEIELVFDKNKSAIYALYSRALRDNPALQGKVVLELTIAPSGEVTECHVVSSGLGDPDLERKLVARVRLFRFAAKDVAPMTTTKPIEFFPG